jgi:coiled-coil domain-containing protein 130
MQGFNMGRYYPPDASNAPTFNASSHPLGKRANKVSQGILTVRFELPFAVWCNHCTPTAIVGQGVRFNAEKKKVGNYYSTPIWSFRMKHSACGGWWEIRTDPKNADYVVIEGAVKRDYGPEDAGAEADGDLKFLTEEEKQRRRNDAFANLEGKKEDEVTDKKNKERVEELYDHSMVWRDPYDVNARLRKDFRETRKVLKKEEKHKEGMQDKFSIGIDIADETEADRMRAKIVEFGGSEATDGDVWKPLFDDTDNKKPRKPVIGTKRLKSELKAEDSRRTLQKALVGNTKAAIDPFLATNKSSKTNPTFSILKRKRNDTQTDAQNTKLPTKTILAEEGSETEKPLQRTASSVALVAYDSD